MKAQVNFFAISEDLRDVLKEAWGGGIFSIASISVEGGLGIVYEHPEHVDELSVAPSGDQAYEKAYLLVPANIPPLEREVSQRAGGVRSVFDQLSAPESVYLRPGGAHGDEVVIAGQLGTISEAEWSLRLCRVLAKLVRRRFEKVGSFYVGSDAARVLDGGGRLTARVRAPKEYDLIRN